jgi:hypothetical protein
MVQKFTAQIFKKPEKLLPCSQNLSSRFILISFSHQRLKSAKKILAVMFSEEHFARTFQLPSSSLQACPTAPS